MADMLDGYKLTKKLGDGMSCIVKLGEKNGQKFAVKIYNKDKLDAKSISKLINEEIAGQKDLPPHDNVVTIRGYSENGTLTKANGKKLNVAYIIMDFVDGGELMDLLIDNGGFTEDIARHFFKQMLRGLNHCHSTGITHRDLKPENMLMTTGNILKLCDFGFAQAVQGRKGHGLASTMIGTPTYMAPEIFLAGRNGGKYDAQKADLYALGIILFIIVFGTFPLDQATEKDNYYKALVSGSWEAFWKAHNGQRKQQGQPDISEELKQLITLMIVPNAALRPTLSDIISHPWTAGAEASIGEVEAEMFRRRADNKTRGEQQVAQDRYAGTAHRDFALNDVNYYEVFDGATAESDNNKILPVQGFNPEVHEYQFQQKVNQKADQIFTQLKALLNSQGVTDDQLKMSNKSWKLKISAERAIGATASQDQQEESKTEEEPLDLKEHVCVQFEVLKDTESNTNYLYTRRNGGSYKYFNDLWTQVKENVLLFE